MEKSPNSFALKYNVEKTDSSSKYDLLTLNVTKYNGFINHDIKVETDYENCDPGLVGLYDSLNVSFPEKEIDTIHAFLTQSLKMTNSHKVKEFTEQSKGNPLPNYPSLMNKDEVKFIIKMVISEMTEMAQTVCDSPQEALEFVRDCVGTDTNMSYKKPTDEMHLIAEQADSAVDAEYYLKNAFAKKGVNLDRIFTIVHKANMDKKFPDGTFHRREDSKVIKPDNWKEPDITSEIEYQKQHGAW